MKAILHFLFRNGSQFLMLCSFQQHQLKLLNCLKQAKAYAACEATNANLKCRAVRLVVKQRKNSLCLRGNWNELLAEKKRRRLTIGITASPVRGSRLIQQQWRHELRSAAGKIQRSALTRIWNPCAVMCWTNPP